MYDQTKEDDLKIKGRARVCVCFCFRDRKTEGREGASLCSSSCNKSCLFCCAWMLIDTSRQKNESVTGIKSCVRSEQQIYLDLI